MTRGRFIVSNWTLLLSIVVWIANAVAAVTTRNTVHASISAVAMIGTSALAWRAWQQQVSASHPPTAAAQQVVINAAPVQRDEDGYWSHPSLPELDEGESAKATAWLEGAGLETHIAYLEDEAIDHPAYARYRGGDGDPNISDWEPPRPEGAGWFVLSIHDTEGWGPICAWARHKEAA